MKKRKALLLTLLLTASLAVNLVYADETAPAAETAAEETAAEETAAAEEETGAEAEAAADAEEAKPELEFWTEDSKAAASIRAYVEAAVDENSEKYIPVEDRLAVFDLDGTIIGELYPSYFEYMMFIHRALYDDSYEAPWDVRACAKALEEGIRTGNLPKGAERLHAEYAGKAYTGMTIDQLKAYTREFMKTEAEGFHNLTRGEAFYKPMVSLVEYLTANDFECYIVSGSDRTVVRALIEDKLPIPVNRVIGMSYTMIATGQGDTDGLDYLYTADDQVILGGDVIIKTIKMNKVSEISLEIGKVPVLAFGNSSGDLSMAQYTENNKEYEGKAYMVLCDDTERELGKPKVAADLKKFCDEHGFETISMRDDFATIYGEDITIVTPEEKEELAKEEALLNADSETQKMLGESPEWVAALPEAKKADQMVVVAGYEGTSAWVSMHEKDADGNWQMIMTTPGFIGKNGFGKEKEGDAKTPTGTYGFNAAFGIADDPGCAIPYQKVTEDDYWSGDDREGMHYNEMVSLEDVPELDTENSEHLIDYVREYQYALNISYNEEGKAGLGSAIFLHCLGPVKPYTGGCVAIPEHQMKLVMEKVKPDCTVVIDTLENLGGYIGTAPAAENEAEAEAEAPAEAETETEAAS